MANLKISQLPAVVTPADTDQIPVNQGGTTKMETRAQMVAGEATARAAADVVLTNAIAAEVTNRTNADSSLQTDIDTRIKKDGTVTFTANQPMGGFKLTGLAAGSTAGDSVRYEQVILANGTNAFSANQSLGGFKFTNSAAPVDSTDLTNKGYVLGLKLHDFTLATASVNMNSQKIINLLDPTASQDAVPLLYMKEVGIWDISRGSADVTIDSNHSFVAGVDAATLYVAGNSITSTRVWDFAADFNYDTRFTIYIPNRFTIGAGSSLTIEGDGTTLKVLGPGTYFSTKFNLYYADGDWRISEEPSYVPTSVAGTTTQQFVRWTSATYNFGASGGSIGTITLSTVIPEGAILLRNQSIIETVTPVTSAGSAEISWGYTGVAAGFDAAKAYSSAPYTTTNLVAGGTVTLPIKLTSAVNITMTIITAALTAGVVNIHVPYLINKF